MGNDVHPYMFALIIDKLQFLINYTLFLAIVRCLKELSDQNIHYKDLDKNKFWSDTVQRCCPDAKSLEEVVNP